MQSVAVQLNCVDAEELRREPSGMFHSMVAHDELDTNSMLLLVTLTATTHPAAVIIGLG